MEDKLAIAVIDSGVNELDPLIQGKEIESFCIEDYQIKQCQGANNSHGTDVIKIILKENSECNIVSIKALNKHNKCSLDDLIVALRYCISRNVQIVNLSLGMVLSDEEKIRELQEVCNQAYENNIVLIAAESNVKENKAYPANFQNVIGVDSNVQSNTSFKIDIHRRNIIYHSHFLYIPSVGAMDIKAGNSFLCAYTTGIYSQLIKENSNNKLAINYLYEFINGCNNSFWFNNYNLEFNYLYKKQIYYFSNVENNNSRRLISSLKEHGRLIECFELIYVQRLEIPSEIDVFYFGEMNTEFVVENKDFINKLIKRLVKRNIDILMLFSVVNTLERMTLTQNGGGTIKCRYL